MKNRAFWTRQGFTLIELLIVVAIIAILAAIAVPNFLEAQTRSKISRAKADMRSMATAVESYAVDNNTPPPGTYSLGTDCNCVGWKPDDDENQRAQALLTTPIAYITDIMDDPFKERGALNINKSKGKPNQRWFEYEDYRIPTEHNDKNFRKTYVLGYTWSFYSVGPMRNTAGPIEKILRGKDITDPEKTRCSYDPSNGTMSLGWIIRTNKGIFTVAGS